MCVPFHEVSPHAYIRARSLNPSNGDIPSREQWAVCIAVQRYWRGCGDGYSHCCAVTY